MSMDAASTITSEALGTENAGNILVNAGNISLFNGSQIRATSASQGVAGDIGITAADSVRLINGSSIASSALRADGGNIDIRAGFMLYLRDSQITTSVGTGRGSGGNITIDPVFVILDNSQIIAQAFGGAGGNITITAGNLFRSPLSVIDASSALGISGSVVISSPIVDLSGSLVTLPASYLDTAALLAHQCAARIAGNASSLVLAGHGGIAPAPDGWLSGAGSIGNQAATAAAVSPAEHRPPLLPLASSRAFGCGW
jgi:large exoprotein involved in heme utilization and adhesion